MYERISWPESQYLSELTDEEMEEYGIELGDDCSYFVPDDVYDEVWEICRERVERC